MTTSINKPYLVLLTASKSLVEVLKTAARIAPKRSSNSALECVLLSFKGDDITIQATDLEVYFQQTVFIPDLGAAQPFSVMVHRKALSTMKAGTRLAFYETFYSIGGIKYTPESQPDEFPMAPTSIGTATETLDALYFGDLAACAVAASSSEVRPILTSVSHRDNFIVATDGLRLCLATQSVTWSDDINVPAQYAALLHKCFGKSGAYVSHNENYARYVGNGFSIVVRLINGQYPDVSRIIPSSNFASSGTVTDIQPWVEALDRSLLLHKQKESRNHDNAVRLVTKDGHKVSLSVRGPGVEFSADLDLVTTGKSIDITFNAQYMKDALLQIGDGAMVQFNGGNLPFLLTSASDKLYQRKALVSPVLIR